MSQIIAIHCRLSGGRGGGGTFTEEWMLQSSESYPREGERGLRIWTEADAYIKIRGEGVVVFKDGTLETNVSIF